MALKPNLFNFKKSAMVKMPTLVVLVWFVHIVHKIIFLLHKSSTYTDET